MFWFLYLIAAIFLSYLIGSIFKRKRFLIPLTCFIIFLTPAQIEAGSGEYAPAIFTFLFDIFLERDISLRPLRPLILSLPISLSLLWLFSSIKRRLF